MVESRRHAHEARVWDWDKEGGHWGHMMTSTTQIFHTLAQPYLAAHACTPGTLQAHLQRKRTFLIIVTIVVCTIKTKSPLDIMKYCYWKELSVYASSSCASLPLS